MTNTIRSGERGWRHGEGSPSQCAAGSLSTDLFYGSLGAGVLP
ncbi:hypothetical protein [Hypericibacter adhaerens]|jgi:hypothetical protein|nr:hypothetical protein [Hypericibacter adhaerens]